MADKSKRSFSFWKELKRRNVFRVIAMYAGIAYVIIELTNNIAQPLRFPEWIPTLVIMLVIIGFPVVGILSWIFDLTPEGIKKTLPAEIVEEEDRAALPTRRKIRPSDIIIGFLVVAVGILIYPKIFKKDNLKNLRDLDGKISVAVMPFENLSGDTLYNIWQDGIQNLLINTLSNSKELSVRQYQSIKNILNNNKNLNSASFAASLGGKLATELEARTYISGNIMKAGDKIRVNTNMVDTQTDEIYKTYQVEGVSEDDFFQMVDSLSYLIKNYIEIKKISEQSESPSVRGISFTRSSEAFKYYINGYDAIMDFETGRAAEWFSKAIETDTTFINAYVLLANTYQLMGNNALSRYWCKKAYNKRNELPVEGQLLLDLLNAYFFETPNEEILYTEQLLDIDKFNPLYWQQLGFAHNRLYEYDEALENWEHILNMYEKWNTPYRNPFIYFLMGNAYHKTGNHIREKEILDLGRELFPDNYLIIQFQAICAFSQGENDMADKLLSVYTSVRKNIIHCTEANISSGLGYIYSSAKLFDKAEDFYRKSLALEPKNPDRMNELAWFLIDNDINVNEGVELINKALEQLPGNWYYLDTKGWGLYKQGKYKEAYKLLSDSWAQKPVYDHSGYLHLKEAELALTEKAI